jgi:uncharacterized protein DUF6704
MSANHGNTIAAWTAVAVVFLGFVVGGIGVMAVNWPTFWVGVALLPLGVIIGAILAKMGHGASR